MRCVRDLLATGEASADGLANQLKDSGARFLVTVPPCLDKAREAAARTGVEAIYVFGSADGARSFAELLEAPPSPPAVTIRPETDVVALPYPSGTTGLPKGVRAGGDSLTHPAVLDAAVARKPDEEAGEVPKAYVMLKPDVAESGPGLTVA